MSAAAPAEIAAPAAHGAAPEVLAELREYTRNAFRVVSGAAPAALPDEPHLEAWDGYLAESGARGVFETLAARLVQLRFPVEAGISETPAYRAATRRGVAPSGPVRGGVRLERPERLRLLVHQTGAGRVPVLVCGSRGDFVTLVRAFAHRGEPAAVPAAMGACLVAGFNNWDRANRHLAERIAAAGRRGERLDRAAALREMIPHRELYQDRFILLSTGDYSATPAAALGVEPGWWREASLRLRLEHECAHYFTLRVLGSARNALHDELIADYAGIVAVAGHFRADWFLRFMGLERADGVRAGGRLAAYRGSPPLSDAAYAAVQVLVRRAAANLERIDQVFPPGTLGDGDRAQRLTALAAMGLEGLAGDAAVERWGEAAAAA